MPEGNISGGGSSRPPQYALALSAAGGGFGGALLAIIIAKILSGPSCCHCDAATSTQKAAQVSAVTISRLAVPAGAPA